MADESAALRSGRAARRHRRPQPGDGAGRAAGGAGSLPRPTTESWPPIATTRSLRRSAFRFLFVRKATQVVLFFHKGQTEVRPLSGTVELRLRASQPSRGAVPASGRQTVERKGRGRAPASAPAELHRPCALAGGAGSLRSRRRCARFAGAVSHRAGGRGIATAIALAEHLEASAVTYFDGVRHELGASWPARPFWIWRWRIAGWLRDQQPGGGASASDPLIDLDLGGMGTSNDAGGVIHAW